MIVENLRLKLEIMVDDEEPNKSMITSGDKPNKSLRFTKMSAKTSDASKTHQLSDEVKIAHEDLVRDLSSVLTKTPQNLIVARLVQELNDSTIKNTNELNNESKLTSSKHKGPGAN